MKASLRTNSYPGEASLSLSTRMPEFRRRLSQDPSWLNQYLAAFSELHAGYSQDSVRRSDRTTSAER
eukprot:9337369-Alexandrium_andersonii.AAC.1